MTLTVSVITPSFNQAAYLERAIRSVLCQEVPGLEHLVFDGGSTDATQSVLEQHAADLRWVSEPDRGQAHAVNKGLRAARGEVIGWLNADDLYEPGAVRAVCELLEARPEVDVVYGQARYVDEAGRRVEPYRTEPWDLRRLQEFCFICQPAAFFRRRVLARYGFLDERLSYCLDYEYWLRLGMGGAQFAYLERLLAGSRLHPEAKTVRSRLRTYVEANDMLRAKLRRVPDPCIFNYAHVAVEELRIPRQHPLPFAAAIVALTCYASLRWNRSIPPSLVGTMARWAAAHTRSRLEQRAAR